MELGTGYRMHGRGRTNAMEVQVERGDIVEASTEVIVNAWNRNIIPWFLLIPMGVSGAIKRHGGYRPFNELLRFGPIPLGEARLTSAGRLPFKGIIHVAGINMLWRSSEYSIRKCVTSAMAIVDAQGFQSVTFPVIGTGSGGFDEEMALACMLDEFTHLESSAEARIVRYGKKGTDCE